MMDTLVGKCVLGVLLVLTVTAISCSFEVKEESGGEDPVQFDRLAKYTTVRLTTDLEQLEPHERQMIPLLIEAAKAMDRVFWKEAYGDRESLLESISDPDIRRYAEINYGPWDRLEGFEPFVEGAPPRPPGANFYPSDMTKEEFRNVAESDPSLRSLYTLVRRSQGGSLEAVPYHRAFSEEHELAAQKLTQAAELAQDPGLEKYLRARADALLTDDYRQSDLDWLDMKNNGIDIVIGPIENYEDKLFGLKTAHEAYVLVKDRAWSRRLTRYAQLLPRLQEDLPVEDKYKQETPGTDSDLNAYDVIYYAGDCNAGSKTIAINLPNDEEVQLRKGTRRLQLKNAMRAKFDRILVPIADRLIVEDQRGHITFEAFFANTMFHEVAHGLGIKNTVNGKGTVREALQEEYSAFEENKADVLGLFMVGQLMESGDFTQGSITDHYVTFLAGIFRSIRFGAGSAHGRANLSRFNYFREAGAFARDEETGAYRVDMEKMESAVRRLAGDILRVQGEGDYEGAKDFMQEKGEISPTLRGDLDRLAEAGIPVDVVFQQGLDVLGLR